MTNSADVVVLGAGPAGLGAAWLLARSGRSVIVLEQSERVGGLSASFDVAGLRVDHGSHRLHPNTSPRILADLRSLLGADLQLRPRNGRIRMTGTFVPFPPSPLGLVRNLSPAISLRLARDLVAAPLRSARADTFDEVVRASIGPTLLAEFYAPLVEKLFGVPANRLHGELARRRVSARRGSDLVRKAMRRGEQGNVFWYPRRGYGQIAETLADAATLAGARVELGATVESITRTSDGVVIDAGGRTFGASAAWSTLPLTTLARLAGGPSTSLRFRAMTLVYLVLEVPRWTRFDAHYLVPASVPVTRVSEPRNYRDSSDDPTGLTVLCAEWPGFVGDDTWTASPEFLADRLRHSLRLEDLFIPDPVAVELRRVDHAYPVYDLDFASELGRLTTWAESMEPQVLTFGRNGLFAHDNAHHALAMGYAAVEALGADGSFDVTRWRAAKAGFATNVVED